MLSLSRRVGHCLTSFKSQCRCVCSSASPWSSCALAQKEMSLLFYETCYENMSFSLCDVQGCSVSTLALPNSSIQMFRTLEEFKKMQKPCCLCFIFLIHPFHELVVFFFTIVLFSLIAVIIFLGGGDFSLYCSRVGWFREEFSIESIHFFNKWHFSRKKKLLFCYINVRLLFSNVCRLFQNWLRVTGRLFEDQQ